MGWLTADEMVKAGIASEIIPDDADAIAFDDAEIKAIDEQGLDIAACLEKPLEKKADGNGKSTEGSAVSIEIAPAAGIDSKNGKAIPKHGDGQDPIIVAAETMGYERGQNDAKAKIEVAHAKELAGFAEQLADRDLLIAKHQSAKDKAEAHTLAVQAECDLKIVGLNKTITDMHEQFKAKVAEMTKQAEEVSSKFAEQITDLTKCLKDANERNSKLLGGGMAFQPAPFETWEEAMQDCKGDYVEAAKKYPKLRDAYNEKHKRK
jgi:hypothetical protein